MSFIANLKLLLVSFNLNINYLSTDLKSSLMVFKHLFLLNVFFLNI